MDSTARKRIYIAWALVVVAGIFDIGTSRATCVNGFVRECEGFDLVNIVCGIVMVALTFKYWGGLGDGYESTLPAKFGVALLDIVGIGVLISGFDGNCSCPRIF